MTTPSVEPFLVLTAILDSSARAASVTRSHGEAMEKAFKAIAGAKVAGLDIVELPIPPATFQGLKKHFHFSDDTVAMYDLFPLSMNLDPGSRKVAGQFLAADVLWTLDAQGLFAGLPVNVKLDLPNGWEKDPKQVHDRLMAAGALDIAAAGIETFKQVKTAWEAAQVK